MHIQITSTITQQTDKEHTASNKVKGKRKKLSMWKKARKQWGKETKKQEKEIVHNKILGVNLNISVNTINVNRQNSKKKTCQTRLKRNMAIICCLPQVYL